MMNSHYPSWNQSFKFHCSPDVKDPLVLTLGNWDEEGRHRVVVGYLTEFLTPACISCGL